MHGWKCTELADMYGSVQNLPVFGGLIRFGGALAYRNTGDERGGLFDFRNTHIGT